MSFAQRYLDLATECSKELKKKRPVNFFGVEAPWTDKDAADIVCGSIEEWEDTVRVSCVIDEEEYNFRFSTYDDCLFNSYCLDADFNADKFLLKYFEDELEEIPSETLTKIFTYFKEKGKISLFSTMYTTAVEAKIIEIYNDKYKELKANYPNLPFYPSLGFSYDLTDYYESSTC